MTDFSQYPLSLPPERLSDSCAYGLKSPVPKSRSYRLSLPPINGSTFTPQTQMIFEIPTGRKNTILDTSLSYLKFGIQVQTTGACAQGFSGCYIDNSAYSFINQLYVYHGGNLLEFLNEYGQLANYLIDNTMSKSQKEGMSSMILCNPVNTTNVIAVNAAGLVGGAYGGSSTGGIVLQTAGDRSGYSLQATTAIATSPVYTATLPLLSGVIGVNAEKSIPIGELKAPIRLEFYLSSADDAIYAGTSGAGMTWQLVNVELELTYIEVDVGQSLFDPERPITIATNTFRQSNLSLASTQSGEWTNLLPFRFSSLNGIYIRFRNQATAVNGANATAAYRKSSSINPNIGNYYFRVNSALYPNKPVYLMNGTLVGGGAEAMAELQKSFHSLGVVTGEPAYSLINYNVASTAYANGIWTAPFAPISKSGATAIDTHANAFSIGQEFQTFSNRNEVLMSGISTQGTEMFFTANIYTGLTAVNACTVDFFANYSMIVIIENGLMRVVT